MFCVFLRFSRNKAQAAQHMAGHQRWIQEGFDDGVFLLTGSLADQHGGMVLAHNTTRDALQARVALDPFVAEDVVAAEITQVTPGKADARLGFLMAGT
ncbi:YciI family protein [Methylibium rhizosphaerae]|uniref:YciI family protein n=1 Tax=Methylibium rhizosphaerae TaxID=2570323 RepID=UPI00112CACBF